jgi:uncharacterized protein
MVREIARAINRGDIDKFDTLIAGGVRIDETTEVEKWNFLHLSLMFSSASSNLQMIKHIINLQVDVNAADCYGNTPLHYASQLKNCELISALLDAGANINAVNLDGVTPLRESLLKKPYNRDVIKLFLLRGADVTNPNSLGRSDLDFVKIISHGEDADIIKLFES